MSFKEKVGKKEEKRKKKAVSWSGKKEDDSKEGQGEQGEKGSWHK